MNKIVHFETVDVNNFQGLDWANTMLESGWTLLSVNGLTLLFGAEKDVAEQYGDLLENRV